MTSFTSPASWQRWRQRPPGDPGLVPLRRHQPHVRRWLSAGCAAAAVGFALNVVAPDAPPGRPVLAATHDVAAGSALRAADVRVERRPADQVPRSAPRAVPAVLGRVLSAPLGEGEVVSTSRLVGPDLLRGRPGGEVLAPVRLADAEVATLLAPGTRVDVLVSADKGQRAQTVARAATVLAGPRPDAEGGGLLPGSTDQGPGGLVLLAVSSDTAARLAQAAAQGPLSVLVR